MTQKTKTIRAYVETLLLAAPQTDALDNVYRSEQTLPPPDKMPSPNAPFINIFTRDKRRDEGQGHHHHFPTKRADLVVSVGAFSSDESALEDILDDLEEQIDARIQSSGKLGGNVIDIQWRETPDELLSNAEMAYAQYDITYEILYLEG